SQTLTFNGVSGGNFALTFNGRTTAPITWTADVLALQSNIQAALDALVTVGPGNARVSQQITEAITLKGSLLGTTLPITLDGTNLFGGSAAISGFGSNILI